MGPIFEKMFQVGWRDVDPNGHVANMVYLEFAVDTRIAYFESCGFPPSEFLKEGFGPVIKSDLAEYFREAVLHDDLRVTIENGGHSEDLSRFRVINTIYNANGEVAVRITSIGGWLDLKTRKLTEPVGRIKEAWLKLSRTEDFETLRSSIRK